MKVLRLLIEGFVKLNNIAMFKEFVDHSIMNMTTDWKDWKN